jgi:hypothetical protein
MVYIGAESDDATRSTNDNSSTAATAANDITDVKPSATSKLANSILPSFKPQTSPVYSLAVHSEAVWALSGLEVSKLYYSF